MPPSRWVGAAELSDACKTLAVQAARGIVDDETRRLVHVVEMLYEGLESRLLHDLRDKGETLELPPGLRAPRNVAPDRVPPHKGLDN